VPTIDQELGEAAVEVAWRLDVYDSYGCNEATALRALKRRAPAYERDACARALDAARILWSECRRVVDANERLINHRGDTDLRPFRREMRSQVRRFGAAVVDHAVGMVVFYYHLK